MPIKDISTEPKSLTAPPSAKARRSLWRASTASVTCLVLGIICFSLASNIDKWIQPPTFAHTLVQKNSSEAKSEIRRLQPKAKAQPVHIHHLSVPLMYSGNAYLREVSLTFDDGPSPTYTPQILAILKHFKVHATFFCIGEQVAEWPQLVQQELAQGHAVGDHTWTHADLPTLSDDGIYQEIQSTFEELKKAGKYRPVFFRPPYGDMNANVLAQAHLLHLMTIMWSVDPTDWALPGINNIVSSIESNVTNGGVVLMHDGGGDRSQTVAALPQVITWLLKHKYAIVPLQQLVDDMNYTPPAKPKAPARNDVWRKSNPFHRYPHDR